MTFFLLFLCLFGRVRERLDYAVVCNGNCRLSPGSRLLYYCIRLVKTVHCAHLCVEMKLHPFADFTCVLPFLSPLQLFKLFEHNHIEVFICIKLYLPTDFDPITF